MSIKSIGTSEWYCDFKSNIDMVKKILQYTNSTSVPHGASTRSSHQRRAERKSCFASVPRHRIDVL